MTGKHQNHTESCEDQSKLSCLVTVFIQVGIKLKLGIYVTKDLINHIDKTKAVIAEQLLFLDLKGPVSQEVF